MLRRIQCAELLEKNVLKLHFRHGAVGSTKSELMCDDDVVIESRSIFVGPAAASTSPPTVLSKVSAASMFFRLVQRRQQRAD